MAPTWDISHGTGAFVADTRLSIPEVVLARGTTMSHSLWPEARLMLRLADRAQHKKDLQSITRLFPDPAERQQVLTWGAALFEAARWPHLLGRTNFKGGNPEQNWLAELAATQPDDALHGHAAWRRLTCAPGVREAELFKLADVLADAVPDAGRRAALLTWAKQRRDQRYLERHFRQDGKPRAVVSRP